MPIPQLTRHTGEKPQRADRLTFGLRMDAFITWFLSVFWGEFYAAVDWINQSLNSISASINTATTKAAEASTSANIAKANADASTAVGAASLWVSGQTYQKFQSVISPLNGRTYRRVAATGAGTADPSSDAANYVLISIGQFPQIRVQDVRAPGTSVQISTVGGNQRTVNTVPINTIPGASVANNNITLPPGTYEFHICGVFSSDTPRHRILLTAGGNVLFSGINMDCNGCATCSGVLVLSVTTTLQILHLIAYGGYYGISVYAGRSELYLDGFFVKVA